MRFWKWEKNFLLRTSTNYPPKQDYIQNLKNIFQKIEKDLVVNQ